MRSVRRVAPFVVLLVFSVAGIAWADDPNPLDPPGARIEPPIGVTSQARAQPPIGVTTDARVAPPIGAPAPNARVNPPIGEPEEEHGFFELALHWLQAHILALSE